MLPGVRTPPAARAEGRGPRERGGGLEVVEAGDFGGGQGEAEQVEVGLDAVWLGGLRDDGDAVLEVPAEDDLGRSDLVAGGDLGQGGIAQAGALSGL